MRKVLFALTVIILGLTSCKGQDLSSYFQKELDSLDRIQPETYKRLKPEGRAYVIGVKTQEQFEGINDQITQAISAGEKNIKVIIERGVYHFHENHILRKNEQAADVSITIEGRNVIITSDEDYQLEEVPTSPWQEMVQLDTLIEVVDKNEKICFIPFKNTLDNEKRTNLTKVQITQWFRAPIYDVTKIDNDGIYFSASELSYETKYRNKGYNVNFDYLYKGSNPRFRLYDKIKEPKCLASRFISLEDCHYRLFSISGITFSSNRSGAALIGMTGVDAQQIMVSDCTFEYICGNVANFSGTGNVMFDHNTIRHTDGNEVRFVNNCPNVRITNNVFENCGQSIGNTFCITCWESTYYVANNTFRNFGYGAIGVGVWHGFEKKYPSQGIIEHNEIYFSPEYFAQKEKYTLMDAGAIYVWTQNDDAIIRYNYIHNYGGMRFNSGIYCDDGASNCKIYGNVILNTPDGCSITSRRVEDQKEGFRNNANNFIANNVVDGAVVFGSSAVDERHCHKGANFVIQTGVQTAYKDKFENLELREEDVIINSNDKLIREKIKQCTHR